MIRNKQFELTGKCSDSEYDIILTPESLENSMQNNKYLFCLKQFREERSFTESTVNHTPQKTETHGKAKNK